MYKKYILISFVMFVFGFSLSKVIQNILTVSNVVHADTVSSWTPPSDLPSNYNSSGPLNEGGVEQHKNGNLGLEGNFASINASFIRLLGTGDLVVGTSSKIGSFQFIDGNQGLDRVLVSDNNGNARWVNISE